MASTAIRVGVVGLGNGGWHYHADGTFQHSARYELVAVCDADEPRAHRAGSAFDATVYTDWRDLAADDAVELIVVALPHHLHRDVSVGCSTAGKHVVVEKPMATTTSDARDMIAAADRAGRLLTVFHQRRWDPDFRAIREAVAAGVIGDLWRAETRRSNAGPYVTAGSTAPHAGSRPAEWAHRRSGGGGVVYLAAPHLVDHLLHLVGRRPRTVAARTHRHADDDVETYVEIMLDFGGLIGRAEVCPTAPVNPPKWAVYGSAGSLASRDGRTLVVAPDGADHQVLGDLPPLRHCDDFYDQLAVAIRDGGPLPVEPRDALAVVAVLETARESAARGGVPVPFREAG